MTESEGIPDQSYLQPLVITDAIPRPGKFAYANEEQEQFPETAAQLADREILGNFDPSRIPPRVAFCSPQARLAIEKDITDLLKHHCIIHPSMIASDLYDPKYKHLPKAFPTIIVKRKSIDLYKGRLRARGDKVGSD